MRKSENCGFTGIKDRMGTAGHRRRGQESIPQQLISQGSEPWKNPYQIQVIAPKCTVHPLGVHATTGRRHDSLALYAYAPAAEPVRVHNPPKG